MLHESTNFILDAIPHRDPYRFVDNIIEVSDDHIIGDYFLDTDSFFFKGHFPESTCTPGFVLTEIMAQIGVLGLGIYLMSDDIANVKQAFLLTADVKFHRISYPNDTILVDSRKKYFRFGKLKCDIRAFNQKNELLCSGVFSGIVK